MKGKWGEGLNILTHIFSYIHVIHRICLINKQKHINHKVQLLTNKSFSQVFSMLNRQTNS